MLVSLLASLTGCLFCRDQVSSFCLICQKFVVCLRRSGRRCSKCQHALVSASTLTNQQYWHGRQRRQRRHDMRFLCPPPRTILVSQSIFCLFLTTSEMAWFTISVDSVCFSVCQTKTFKGLHTGSSYLHIPCISTQYGSYSYMKVIGSRSRSRDQKKVHNRYATDPCVSGQIHVCTL